MTTMVDFLDAPMLDYPTDLDISMNTSLSENWLYEHTDESRMDDDAQVSGDGDDSTVLVEVEMEPYEDTQTREYEMADTVTTLTAHEYQDIELHDASHAGSPAHIATPRPLPHSSEFDRTLDPRTDNQDFNLHHDRVTYGTESATSTATVEPKFVDTKLPPSPAVLEAHEEAHEDATATLVHQNESRNGLLATLVAIDGAFEDPENDHLAPQPAEFVNKPEHITDSLGNSGGAPSVATENELAQLDTHPETTEAAVINEEQLATEMTHSQINYHSEEQTTAELLSSDLQELPEGEFADAAPPVLLQLPDGEAAEFYLFSRLDLSTIVNEGTAESNGELLEVADENILFAGQSALFYAPISALCESIRQEIDVVPNLHEVEIAVEATDLQLSLSEDNVHARDYSLHDIHSLHIHSNLSGPLRLRLQIVGPRFTIRYQQLQSELVAFSTKEGQEKSDVAAAASHGQSASSSTEEISASTDSQSEELRLPEDPLADLPALPDDEDDFAEYGAPEYVDEGAQDEQQQFDDQLSLIQPRDTTQVEPALGVHEAHDDEGHQETYGEPTAEEFHGNQFFEHESEVQDQPPHPSEVLPSEIANDRIQNDEENHEHQPSEKNIGAPQPNESSFEHNDGLQLSVAPVTVEQQSESALIEHQERDETQNNARITKPLASDVSEVIDVSSNAYEGSDSLTPQPFVASELPHDDDHNGNNATEHTDNVEEDYEGVEQSTIPEYEEYDYPEAETEQDAIYNGEDHDTEEDGQYEEVYEDDDEIYNQNEDENDQETASNEISVILSNKASSKRGFDEVEADDQCTISPRSPLGSPGSKRVRIH